MRLAVALLLAVCLAAHQVSPVGFAFDGLNRWAGRRIFGLSCRKARP